MSLKDKKKRARNSCARPYFQGGFGNALNWAGTGVIDVNYRSLDVNSWHARDVHAHLRTGDLGYLNVYGTEIGFRKVDSGKFRLNLSLHPGTVGLNPCQFRLLAGGHGFKIIAFGVARG